jgi:uncharacterized protein YwqG
MPSWSSPPADVEDFVSRLDQVGLSSYADRLVQLVRPAIRLVPSAAAARLGGTRLGGEPDLPGGTPWLEGPNGPLSFILQVDLGTMTTLVPDEGPPASGLLAFFYDAVSQEAWGFDPIDRGSWAVIYSSAEDELLPRAAPAALPAEGRFAGVDLKPVKELSFPVVESPGVRELGIFGPDLWWTYSRVLGSADETIIKLLGNPDPIQGDMQEECQLASNGIYCGDSKYGDDSRAQALAKDSGRWRLLLQVDSLDAAGMMWGDVGRIYFWLTDEDLRAHRWEEAWFVLQCS